MVKWHCSSQVVTVLCGSLKRPHQLLLRIQVSRWFALLTAIYCNSHRCDENFTDARVRILGCGTTPRAVQMKRLAALAVCAGSVMFAVAYIFASPVQYASKTPLPIVNKWRFNKHSSTAFDCISARISSHICALHFWLLSTALWWTWLLTYDKNSNKKLIHEKVIWCGMYCLLCTVTWNPYAELTIGLLFMQSLYDSQIMRLPGGVPVTFTPTTDSQFSQWVIISLLEAIHVSHICTDFTHQTVQFGLKLMRCYRLTDRRGNTRISLTEMTLWAERNFWWEIQSGKFTWSGLRRLNTIRISVAVTQSCNTGDCSNSNADGRPSSVANATRLAIGVSTWASVHNASWNTHFCHLTWLVSRDI